MQEGWSYEAIAEAEGLSRERIRQIVREDLEGRDVEPSGDHLRLQMARLDPALRLAAAKVAAGEITAVDRLIRVLNQMDKYQGKAAPAPSFESADDARERILAKLSDVDQRRAAYAEDDPTDFGGAEEAAEDDSVSKFFPRQVVDVARNGKA